jgi:hypothetical protein
MTAYESILQKFELNQFTLANLPVFQTVFSNNTIIKLVTYPRDKLNLIINFQSIYKKFFVFSLTLFILVTLIFLAKIFTGNWFETNLGIENVLVFYMLSITLVIFLLAYLLNNRAEYRRQLAHILISFGNAPDLIFQNSEAEDDQKTLALFLADNKIAFDHSPSTEAVLHSLDELTDWQIRCRIIHHNMTHSRTNAGNAIGHDLYMIPMQFFIKKDPYSMIDYSYKKYLEQIELEILFINGQKIRLNVQANPMNQEHAQRGYEDFQIYNRRFKKMQGLLKAGIILNKVCPAKGSFTESVILKD